MANVLYDVVKSSGNMCAFMGCIGGDSLRCKRSWIIQYLLGHLGY